MTLAKDIACVFDALTPLLNHYRDAINTNAAVHIIREKILYACCNRASGFVSLNRLKRFVSEQRQE